MPSKSWRRRYEMKHGLNLCLPRRHKAKTNDGLFLVILFFYNSVTPRWTHSNSQSQHGKSAELFWIYMSTVSWVCLWGCSSVSLLATPDNPKGGRWSYPEPYLQTGSTKDVGSLTCWQMRIVPAPILWVIKTHFCTFPLPKGEVAS